ncbi:hypothetical protein ACHAAC_17090 [Aeromicrobium sp. CF4.19]|uniref:hypothetical protein n=1 Tax=Aeromicrobium sp. CF4.19 TaxID=3373082 RepID=UPI003EE7C95F
MTTTTYVTDPCQICGTATTLKLPLDVVERLGLVPVQDLLPDIDPEQRELIRHGTHPGCWRSVFGPNPN